MLSEESGGGEDALTQQAQDGDLSVSKPSSPSGLPSVKEEGDASGDDGLFATEAEGQEEQQQQQQQESPQEGDIEPETDANIISNASLHVADQTSTADPQESIGEQQYKDGVATKRASLRQALVDAAQLPASYLTLSPKEERALRYVENFRRQYSMLYPNRNELLLAPPNELGVRKFISTWIRPTQLPYKQLYEYRSCARFVADYILYDPLDPPYDLPAVVPSSTYTLAMQLGNSFDMSILLTSLLRGVGYDAYVVSGYASRQITLMDETSVEVDVPRLLTDWGVADVDEPNSASAVTKPTKPVSGDAVNGTGSKYKVKQKPPLKSKFLASMEAKARAAEEKRIEQERLAALKNTGSDRRASDDDQDAIMGMRVHAWVLMLPGKREIAEPFFIEPSTGKIYDVDSEHYLGVESVFSSLNYWVNMQPCINGLKNVSFDLGDNAKWEFVFLENSQPGMSRGNRDPNDPTADLGDDDEFASGKRAQSAEGAGGNASANPSLRQTTASNQVTGTVPSSAGGGMTGDGSGARGAGSAASGAGELPSSASNAGGGGGATTDGNADSFDIPRSWVAPLSISREQFQSRCPSGSKCITYRNAKLEIFAPYHRPDGMVTRLTVFSDPRRNQRGEIRQWFDNRRDRLLQRVRVPQHGMIKEYFDRGRQYALAAHTAVHGKTTEMLFYEGARSDGLVRRQQSERKVIEWFVDREDRLTYRSVTSEHHREVGESGQEVTHSSFLKMTEKYARNPALPALEDIAKRTYFMRDERIRTVAHLPDGCLIPSWREFRKPSAEQKASFSELMTYFDADPVGTIKTVRLGAIAAANVSNNVAAAASAAAAALNAGRSPNEGDNAVATTNIATPTSTIKKQHIYAKLCDLLKAEQACLQSVKANEREIKEILAVPFNGTLVLPPDTDGQVNRVQARAAEEKDIQLVISLYDTIRNQTDTAAEKDKVHQKSNEDGVKDMSVDYLSPFILSVASQAANNANSAHGGHPSAKHHGDSAHNSASTAAAAAAAAATASMATTGTITTVADAIAVRDAALKAFKERLIEKANIIQRRYDEETTAYQKRQQLYNRNAETMTSEETEEYVQFCNDALFRIHVLEKRLNRHKETAPEKFMALEKRLRVDPRLAKFLKD
ncbi:hypothetical protein RI367_006258 [Sorochytrium milnesiophthora]